MAVLPFVSWLCTFPFGSVLPSTLHWPDLGVLHGLLGSHPFGCNWMRVKSFWKWPLKDSISSRLYSECDLVCVCHSQRCQSYCRLILQWLCRPSFALEGRALLPRMTALWNDQGNVDGGQSCLWNQDGRLLERRGCAQRSQIRWHQTVLKAPDWESEKHSAVLYSGSVARRASMAF